MLILLDTNIVLDYLLHREHFVEAKAIIDLAINDLENEYVSSSIITDIHYIASNFRDSFSHEKKYTSYEVQDMIFKLKQVVGIADVTAQDIDTALSLRWKDFEDAVQYSVALSNHIDCIVTNNVKDFENPIIPVLTPHEFSFFRDEVYKKEESDLEVEDEDEYQR